MNQDFIQQTEVLVEQAVLGEQVDAFMRSDVGRFIAQRLDLDYEAAIEQLKEVDATDAKAVVAAQMNVRVPERIRQWLTQAISQGLQATKVLEHRQFEDEEPEGM
jgi:hypothetical protein